MLKIKSFTTLLFSAAASAAIAGTLFSTVLSISASAQTSQSPCFSTLAEADRLYGQGDRAGAEQLYRQCKQPFAQQDLATYFPTAISDPEQLRPAGRVYWREVQKRLERGQADRALVPLNLLIAESPEFSPAYAALARAFESDGRSEEAVEALEKAATLFPYDADIAEARVTSLRIARKPLEASMAARLFAIVNPDSPQKELFMTMAEADLDTFKSELKTEYLSAGIGGAIINILLGKGDTFSKAIDSVAFASLLIKGEAATGSQLAAATLATATDNNTLIDDPVVLEYVNTIGQDLARQMGRDEFDYEFHVIKDEAINAFALPGGKVFINTGAILAAQSEADLAGLIGHEVAHCRSLAWLSAAGNRRAA